MLLNITDEKSTLVMVSSGNKPLPEPVLTQSYVTMWHHLATMSYPIDNVAVI